MEKKSKQQRYRDRHEAKGLCLRCKRKVMPNSKYCEYHREYFKRRRLEKINNDKQIN